MRHNLTMLGASTLFILALSALLPLRAGAQAAMPECKSGWEELERVENIERIFMLTTRSYAFLVRESASTLVPRTMESSRKVRFIEDIAADAPMWAAYYRCPSEFAFLNDHVLVIHLHSVKKVEGGGWTKTEMGFKGWTTEIRRMSHVIE